jgi:hypothetical protein
MERKRWKKTARWIFYPVMVGAIVFLVVTQPQEQKYLEGKNYSCLIEPEKKEILGQEGDRIPLRLKIKNRGKKAWSSEGEFPIFLSYHLYLKETYRTIQYENRRFPLPQKVEPGQRIDMTIHLRAPLKADKYIVQFDLVREGQAWFRDYGSRTAIIALSIAENEWPEDHHPISLEYGKFTRFDSSQDEFNTIQKLIRMTLHHNEVSFEGQTGTVEGFAAGKNYPQIWLRDANTIIPVSRYIYGKSFLTSWIEEHLAFQKKDGSLQDWIDSRGKFDKNTTETDQESSAVQASFQIYTMLGPQWLRKKIMDKTILDRLDLALQHVLDFRWNKQYGLFAGAHTADWGDVDMVDENQEAVYVDERTHWTADIYDQSMFYLACLNLAEMLRSLGKTERAIFWEKKARLLKQNTNKELWQETKGFYRIHIHLDGLEHDFDEADMFAMGGNIQAILSGLAGEDKAQKILQQALKRQKTYGLSTISGTLLPPYPKNIFKHPLVDDPYEYQNGAQWDWFGGRLICALFQNGLSRLAKEKLVEIFRKNIHNRGFFEWDNKEGHGRGSDFYAGSAGSLGRALFEGYFGLDLQRNNLRLTPRLGKDRAKIHVYQPANDSFLAYDYRFDSESQSITLEYNSSFPGMGTIRILSPWPDADFFVQIDGNTVHSWLETKGEDTYIAFSSDYKHHKAKIEHRN